ncbi:Unknown protein sequence, partial [Pseudomonas syringae pv. castaneae]
LFQQNRSIAATQHRLLRLWGMALKWLRSPRAVTEAAVSDINKILTRLSHQ